MNLEMLKDIPLLIFYGMAIFAFLMFICLISAKKKDREDHNEEIIYKSYKEAEKVAFESEWKIQTCSTGYKCWCRIIVPKNKILYERRINKFDDYIDEFDIVGSGSIRKEVAKHIVKLQNNSLKKNKLKRLLK